MLRIWFFLSLLLFAPVGGGLVPPASPGVVCTQRCEDDDERGQCAPDCLDCTCCSHLRQVVLTPTLSSLPRAPRPPPVEHEEDEPTSVEVGDILHIPIVALA
ncbi:hypothetical protein [Archangium lipolyticum]|uniref:hypothetical protein n=1 Tax=Archangium lipolyticum TaxID=2970465 RepID=UPI00214A0807|nr:hypothetical protein [Archangium lipolyticum]